MVRANYIIFSLIYTVTTNFNTLSKREAARVAKYIVHTGNVKYIYVICRLGGPYGEKL